MSNQSPAFESIENAILDRIRAEVPALKTVESYAGQLDEDGAKQMPVRFPAAFVSYRSGAFEPVDGPIHRETMTFTIIVAGRTPRGNHEAVYPIVGGVLGALANHTPVPGGSRLRPVRTAIIFNNRQLVAYGVDISIGVDTEYDWT